MKCRVKYYIFLVPALLFFFFGFSIINPNNASAVSDISVTYNSGFHTTAWTDIFSSCTGSCFHDYNYLVVKLSNSNNLGFPSNSNTISSTMRIYGRSDGSNSRTWFISLNAPEQIYPISFSDSPVNYFQWGNGSTLDSDITFILTNSPYGSAPSGSITLTENGTYDVTTYAQAIVDVPFETIPGDYHDDLISIRNCIIACAGVCLVIYFFYCIYRMIIKSSGGH